MKIYKIVSFLHKKRIINSIHILNVVSYPIESTMSDSIPC